MQYFSLTRPLVKKTAIFRCFYNQLKFKYLQKQPNIYSIKKVYICRKKHDLSLHNISF